MDYAEGLIGKRFGRLVVTEAWKEKEKRRDNNHTVCRCVCDCGNCVTIPSDRLKTGKTRSCGCLKSESSSSRALLRNVKHGWSRTKLYKTWRDMKYRCEDPNKQRYKNYGGRGISVCKEWDESFECFRDWALENGYSVGLTIDRIDVNGNYEPSNCRWATKEEQGGNKQNTRWVTAFGETKTLREWSERYGIKAATIEARLLNGWLQEEAVSSPTRKTKKLSRTIGKTGDEGY